MSDSDLWCYGWPAPFSKQRNPSLISAFAHGLYVIPFLVDVGYALFLTLGAGWINERWLAFVDVMRRCMRKPQKLEEPTP